jgi:hypothetical protein
LIDIVPGWIHRLETLSACIEYARVPDGYWKVKGKQLVDAVMKAPDKAVDIAQLHILKIRWPRGG